MANRIFRITISGHGGEFAFSKSSLDEYMYWNSDEARLILEDQEDENPLMEYLLNKDWDENVERFDSVKFKRDGNWEYQDDIDHNFGVNLDFAYLTVEEVTSLDWEANVIDTIYDHVSLSNAIDDNDLDVNYVEETCEGCSHVLACVSIEKGVFFQNYLTTDGADFDINKLSFSTKNYPTEDEIVEWVYYDGQQLDSDECNTNTKGMFVEIIEV